MNVKSYFLSKSLLTSLLISTMFNAVAHAQDDQAGLGNLEQKMQAIGQYYQQINEKLNPSLQQKNYIAPNGRRDPFAYTEQMYRNQQRNAPQQGNVNVTPNAVMLGMTHQFTADGLPIMKYRGYGESATGQVIGLLEIYGMGVYTVRVGDKIGLHEIVKELVLTIEGLSRNNIIIETGKLGKQMVIQ
ncbi:MAG: hypothetical protein HRU23_19845 [Gammaproteobacteria bacterium]|nr:hypothetical protein [Gammaproteobacteria bacterium]